MRRFAERFLHVDMDAFFVEVERLRSADLRGRAVIVGGLGPRGVVASASYEARNRGVRSAMPMIEARRRCPHARFVTPDHRRYRAVSDEVFAVLRSFTPEVEALSIDEAFLDIAGLRLHYQEPAAVGTAIRQRIREEIGIPSSVGIASSKFVAKTASGKAKPDGIRVIAAGAELAFLHPLPISDLWGVGAVTQAALASLGIATIGDLATTPSVTLQRHLGQTVGAQLAALARAEDDRPVVTDSSARSISVEETYPDDLTTSEAIERELLRLCDRLAARLHRSGLGGRTVTLKVRFEDFTTVSRSRRSPIRSIDAPTSGRRAGGCSIGFVSGGGRFGSSESASPDWSASRCRSSSRSPITSVTRSPTPQSRCALVSGTRSASRPADRSTRGASTPTRVEDAQGKRKTAGVVNAGLGILTARTRPRDGR